MTAGLSKRLQLGEVPRVVGTIITAEYLKNWDRERAGLPCDLVELRVDGFSDYSDWISIGKEIEKSGTPVFVTVRLAREGGHWEGEDRDRWKLLEPAIRELSGVDVEIRSELAPAVSELCGELGKMAVFSFHDFKATPAKAELEELLTTAKRLGGIGKIAATANSLEDVEQLRSMLRAGWGTPICIIGMGQYGRETRLQFPKKGSCFTYGYLDRAGAPGQYSAAELTEYFATGCTNKGE